MNPVVLVDSLMRNNVPSISPQTATRLLEIEVQVRGAYEKEDNLETAPLLRAYADSLKVVCVTSALHQGAVITKVERLVKRMKVGGEPQ